MSKGMVYTSFALMASALLVSGAFALSQETGSTSSATRITEASFFMDSVLQDMDRSLSMGTRRAFTATVNYVITNEQPLDNPESAINSALINGSLKGQQLDTMEGVSLESWTERVSGIAEESSYSLETQITGYGMNSSGTDLDAYYRVNASLKDPVSLARFNRSKRADTTVSLSGIEDPMITLRSDSEYVSTLDTCSFEQPAEQLETAAVHTDSYAYGEAVVEPSDVSSVDSRFKKILVTEDVDSYTVSEANSFEGVVSADSNSSSGYTNVYAFETGSVSDLQNGMAMLVDRDTVWRTSFAEMFIEGCYVSDPSGPDLLDRLGNQVSAESEGGIATLIDLSRLPADIRDEGSAVGHVYFEDGSSDLNEVKGVSDEYPWFRLDQEHVERWEIGSIIK